MRSSSLLSSRTGDTLTRCGWAAGGNGDGAVTIVGIGNDDDEEMLLDDEDDVEEEEEDDEDDGLDDDVSLSCDGDARARDGDGDDDVRVSLLLRPLLRDDTPRTGVSISVTVDDDDDVAADLSFFSFFGRPGPRRFLATGGSITPSSSATTVLPLSLLLLPLLSLLFDDDDDDGAGGGGGGGVSTLVAAAAGVSSSLLFAVSRSRFMPDLLLRSLLAAAEVLVPIDGRRGPPRGNASALCNACRYSRSCSSCHTNVFHARGRPLHFLHIHGR